MSQPFPTGPGTAPPGGPAPGAFGAPPYAPPPQKSKWWMWLLGGCGCMSVLLVLCCGGMSYFGFSKGMGAFGDMVKTEVANNDDVKEHLGEITSMKMNFMETANEQKARGGKNLIVFDAEGTEGDGQFIVETPQGGQGGPFSSIDLKLPDGTVKKIK